MIVVVCFEQVVRRAIGLNDHQHIQLHRKNCWHFYRERHAFSSFLRVAIRSVALDSSLVGFCNISEANFAFFEICLVTKRYRTKPQSIGNLNPLASTATTASASSLMISFNTSWTTSILFSITLNCLAWHMACTAYQKRFQFPFFLNRRVLALSPIVHVQCWYQKKNYLFNNRDHIW